MEYVTCDSYPYAELIVWLPDLNFKNNEHLGSVGSKIPTLCHTIY